MIQIQASICCVIDFALLFIFMSFPIFLQIDKKQHEFGFV